MYSMVLMAALTSGTELPAFHHLRGCHGCCGGCYGCSGGCYGCHGCHGGWFAHGCHGCHGAWIGHGCHGWCGGWACHGCHGCYGATCYGCTGCTGCTGCSGCCGGYIVTDVSPEVAPPVAPAPEKVVPAPKKTTSLTPERARLVVELPANATLYVDGNAVRTSSANRSFNTPPLEPGQAYYYMLRAEVVRDGQTITETTRVIVRAGEEARASFPNLEGNNASTVQADR